MHTTKPIDKKLAFLFLDEFIVGMGNVGSVWSAGSSMEPPKTNSKSAWSDVSRSFRSAGNDLRWAITNTNPDE